MAARSVLVVASPSIVDPLRDACPEFDVRETSLDDLEGAIVRVDPTAVVAWEAPIEGVLPVVGRIRARDRGAHLIVVTPTGDGRLAALAAGSMRPCLRSGSTSSRGACA